jgi:hypothetical protein
MVDFEPAAPKKGFRSSKLSLQTKTGITRKIEKKEQIIFFITLIFITD